MPSYLNELMGIQAEPGGIVPTLPQIQRKPTGFIESAFDIISRPSYAVSEAIGAARAKEDIFEAAWRGLRGRRKYPSLGYQAFPEAQQKGFQPLDLAAFAIDVVADPLTWVGPSLIKGIAKPVSKLTLRGAEALLPKVTKILPEFERGLSSADSMKKLFTEMKDLRIGAEGLMKRMEIAAPREEIKTLLKVARSGKYVSSKTGEVVTGSKGTSFRRMLKANPWLVDEMRQQMRLMEANYNVTARGSMSSLARDVGTNVMPIIKSLKRFGGPAGEKIADKWERGILGARFDTEKYFAPLAEAAKPLGRATKDLAERVQSVRLREMGEVMRPMVTDKAAEFAGKWGKVVDDMRDELLKFRDPLGNELQVWNPVKGPNGRWEPFSQHIQPGYYPRVYPKEFFTNEGAKGLYERLLAEGKTHREAEAVLARLGHRPTRVGHIEMARLGNEAGYELDPLKTLPKYIYDVMLRKNMAKEFGVNNELLDVALQDLSRAGLNRKYIGQVREAITGKTFHDSLWEKLSSGINSFQALAKLGYATSVANFGQGPLNQSVRSGFWNTAQSILKTAKGERGGLGAVAFSRASREDIMRGMLGGSSKFMDRYMKLIGFDWTERFGRHMGAIGGEMEAADMAKTWLARVGEAAAGNKKAMKEAGRLESELMRRYKIPVAMIDEAGKLPANVLEEAGIMAADKTMHAFFPGELPPGWRSPFWRTALQFKSFIYKQSEFMMSEVLGPGMQWFATDGAKGDVMPLLRMFVAMPIGAELVTHFRDLAKSAPHHIGSLITQGKFSDRKLKEFFWEADSPAARVMSDLTYVGTFGMLGDAIDSAAEGRLWKWAVGPTFSDIIEMTESAVNQPQKLGEFVTRQLPGAAGIPYGTDIFESIQRTLRKRSVR